MIVLLSIFKFLDSAPQGLADFRKLARAKEDQNNYENNDQLSESNAHFLPPCA